MKEFFSKHIILPAILITVFYVVVTIYLMNAGLVKDALLGDHSLSYKWNLLIALLLGMWTAMSRLSLFLLTIIAILTGVNLTLVFHRFRAIKASGKMRLMVGGSSLLGVIGSGCVSCGLPILALLGLSGAIFYLPFQGLELSLFAIIVLSFSLYTLIRQRTKQAVCDVVPTNQIKHGVNQSLIK